MSSETLSHDEAIGQFCGVTGADEERAKGLLEACDWNLELAINMHVDTDDGRGNKHGTFKAGTSAALDGASTSNAARVVNIDSQEDDDIDDDSNKQPTFGPIIDANQQQSLSSHRLEQTTSADYVRPPIRPIRQVLVQSPMDYSPDIPPRNVARRGRYNTRAGASAISDVYDAFRDFQAEARWQEMAQEGESSATSDPTNNINKRRTLQDLFRPPLELMFRGSMASAREVSTLQNKWLLVNIQDGREFACQILNRDVWSNQAVKDILKEHFIFWQVYHDSFEGNRYVQFYNVSKYPHVSIIDPRTGELMKSWPTSIDHNLFCDSVIEFLTEHPSPDGSGDANTMKKMRVKEEDVTASRTLYDQSEEAQLEAAIKASLEESDENKTIDLDDSSESSSMFERLDRRMDDVLIDKPRPTVDGQMSTDTGVSFSKHFENSSGRVKNGSIGSRVTPEQFVQDTTTFNDTGRSKLNSNNNSGQEKSINSIKKETYRRPTPPPGMACKIALRFPDGTSTVQKFSSQELLSDVKLFVQVEKETASDCDIEFIAPPNMKLTESMMGHTLESLGLCPASRLEVRYA